MKYLGLIALGAVVTLAGCATQSQPQQNGQLQQQLSQAQQKQSQLEQQNAQLKQQLAENSSRQSAPSTQPASMSGPLNLVPPNAKPGECFARVVTPAKYKTTTKKLLRDAASTKVETIPAKYKWTTKRIMVSPEATKLVAVPATYKMHSQKVMVRDSYTKWVPGHGSHERIDPASGMTMCLVKVPAKYETVKNRVVDTPAHTKKVTIPAKYKTVKIRELVQDATTRTIDIPARYQTVKQTEKVQNSEVKWSRVVCDRNATHDLISQVQTALKKQGYKRGPIDGLLGPLTMNGVRAYDKDNNLAYSKAQVITYATLDSLGVKKPQ